MYDYMLNEARGDVWCNPLQDNQLIFLPERVTQGAGSLNTVALLERHIALPKKKIRTHVYQIGQLSPALLGLLERNPGWLREKWFSFSEAMNKLNLYVTIYTETGVLIPRFNAHFMFTKEKCLVFAIPSDSRLGIDLGVERVYFRLYTNAYFKSEAAQLSPNRVYCKGYEPKNVNDIILAQFDYNISAAKPGLTEAFVNGYLVSNISPVTVRPGDIVEWIYDSSVKRIVTFNISDLQQFVSTLDNKDKYLLHYQGSDLTMIDFHDDIDISIRNKPANAALYKGRYYPKNLPMSHRMVTHRDYSVTAEFVTYISRELAISLGEVIPDLLSYQLTMKIREGGYHRALIYDNNRIFELYKLPNNEVVNAMVGVNSLVPEWQAATLEASSYTAIMRSLYKDVNIDQVEKGYGYNSIAKILGDTPTKTFLNSGIQRANLPYGLMTNSTFYEFNQNGALVGQHYHLNDDDYEARDPNTRLIEGISGKGGLVQNVKYGKTNIPIDPNYTYRVYHCKVVNGNPTNLWEDYTDNPLCTVVANKLVWNGEFSDHMLMVRINDTFLSYDFLMRPNAGILSFTLVERTNKGLGLVTAPMTVPMGELCIWMNGYKLIRGIDYILKFPYVYVNNYTYLVQPAAVATQNFHIRFTGFCRSDMTMEETNEVGFVEHGALSNNRRYNLRDDKVQQIAVGGCIYHRSDAKFFENLPGYDIMNSLNGQPYEISDIVVPLRNFVSKDTYKLRSLSKDIDSRVSDYMTQYYPPSPPWVNSSSSRRYRLVSVFFNHLLYLLETNVLIYEDTRIFSDQQVRDICAPYEPLLEYDPLAPENALDDKFVVITPTNKNVPTRVSRGQYRFLRTAIRLYGDGKVGINNFVTFSVT